MPQCCVGEKCLCPAAPPDVRHLCAICKEQLHGPCGIFNDDDIVLSPTAIDAFLAVIPMKEVLCQPLQCTATL
jgi:hypothetical protein